MQTAERTELPAEFLQDMRNRHPSVLAHLPAKPVVFDVFSSWRLDSGSYADMAEAVVSAWDRRCAALKPGDDVHPPRPHLMHSNLSSVDEVAEVCRWAFPIEMPKRTCQLVHSTVQLNVHHKGHPCRLCHELPSAAALSWHHGCIQFVTPAGLYSCITTVQCLQVAREDQAISVRLRQSGRQLPAFPAGGWQHGRDPHCQHRHEGCAGALGAHSCR